MFIKASQIGSTSTGFIEVNSTERPEMDITSYDNLLIQVKVVIMVIYIFIMQVIQNIVLLQYNN